MDMFNLKNYIFHYENAVNPDICKALVKECESMSWQLIPWSTYSNKQLKVADNNTVHNQTERPLEMTAKFKLSLNPIIQNQILKYTQNKFAMFSVNGFSTLTLHRYRPGSLCLKHVDHVYSLFDGEKKGIPVLSIVGLLNDDFEGGEFVFWDEYQVPLKAGSILIFPSNFLYPHSVNTILKGTRFSFVSWVW